MASLLTDLLHDPQQGFLGHAAKLLRQWCSRSLREQIASLYCGTPKASERDILDTAASELVGQLLKNSAAVEPLLVKLQHDMELGELSREDVWTQIFNKGFSYLRRSLSDTARQQDPAKHLYKSLRECLAKSGKVARDSEGKAYGPPGLPPESPVAPTNTEGFTDFPEPEDLPPKKEVASQSYLVPQALRFWDIYMRQRLDGIPHFLPIYTLQGWLCRKFTFLSPSGQKSLDGEDADRLLAELPTWLAPDDSAKGRELQERVENFVQSLPDRLVTLCALYFADDDARQEDVARALGYSSAAGLDRPKKELMRRLRDFMTQYIELSDQDPDGERVAQDFLDAVCDACKMRHAASNGEAGGLHHD